MSTALSPDTTLAHYTILCKIGAGGMGEVYRARDEKLNREVAIKILPADIAHDERLMRFKREAQVLASLNHPNVAAIYGFEDSNHVIALVMELVEGPTLEDRVANGPLPTPEALADLGFSPDGRFIIYDAHPSPGIYIQPFPGPGRRQLIDQSGIDPVWRGDGKEIVFVRDN